MKKALSILISLILVITMLTSTACNPSNGKTEGTTEQTETKADTFRGQVESYLLSIGVTEGEIASIRESFLED